MPRKKVTAERAAAAIDATALAATRNDPGVVPTLPATDEGLVASFFGRVHDYARAWIGELHARNPQESRPWAIILSRTFSSDVARLNAETYPYLSACPDADIGGKILIANDTLSMVARVPSSSCDALPGIGHTIEALGLHEYPHVVVRPDRKELIICRRGVLDENSCLPIVAEKGNRISLDEMESILWEFHRRFTQTPSGYILCWTGSPANRVTIPELERQISGLASFFIGTKVGYDNVVSENYTPHGRIDIKITGHAMQDDVGPCVLEWKVLRSRMFSTVDRRGWTSVSENEMIKHAKEGVDQAIEYRQDINAKFSYLCCFDARLNDVDQSDVVLYANENDVRLKRYYMYVDTGEHRKAAAAARSAGVLLSGEVN